MQSVRVIGSGNAFNSDGRAHAAYLIEDSSKERVLMDCGATTLYRLQALQIPCDSIDTVLLTHFHGDHYGGLPFLLLQLGLIEARRRPLHICGPQGVQTACEHLMEAMYPALELHFEIQYHPLQPGLDMAPLHAQSQLQVQAIPMDHKAESLGYRLRGSTGRTLAFSGDCRLDQKVLDLIAGMDLALVELTMPAQYNPPVAHVALDEVLAWRNRFQARRLVWTHIYNDLARQAREHGLEVAEDGMLLELASS